MEQVMVAVLGQLLAAYAEIEGMKAENKQNEMAGRPIPYGLQDFYTKAEQIHNIYNQLYR